MKLLHNFTPLTTWSKWNCHTWQITTTLKFLGKKPEESVKQLSHWYKSNERPPTLALLSKNRNYSSLYLFSPSFNSEENGSTSTNELSAWPPTTLLIRWEARPANQNGHTGDNNLPHLRANHLRLAGRAHEPRRAEEDSPDTEKKDTHAHLKRVVGGQEALNLHIQPHHYLIRNF